MLWHWMSLWCSSICWTVLLNENELFDFLDTQIDAKKKIFVKTIRHTNCEGTEFQKLSKPNEIVTVKIQSECALCHFPRDGTDSTVWVHIQTLFPKPALRKLNRWGKNLVRNDHFRFFWDRDDKINLLYSIMKFVMTYWFKIFIFSSKQYKY